MQKTIASMIGTVAAATLCNPAEAAPSHPMAPPPVQSYSDLLQPIPNALELLTEEDKVAETETAKVELARYHHHHHSARRIIRRLFRPLVRGHHHHHHHNSWRRNYHR